MKNISWCSLMLIIACGSTEAADKIRIAVPEPNAAFLDRRMHERAAKKRNRYAERVMAEECKESGGSLTELRSGNHRGRLPATRTKIVASSWRITE